MNTIKRLANSRPMLNLQRILRLIRTHQIKDDNLELQIKFYDVSFSEAIHH